MKTIIEDISPDRLPEYASIPIAFKVKSVLEVTLVDGGLGGMLLHEEPVRPTIREKKIDDN